MATTTMYYRSSPPDLFPGGDPAVFTNGVGSVILIGVAGPAGPSVVNGSTATPLTGLLGGTGALVVAYTGISGGLLT